MESSIQPTAPELYLYEKRKNKREAALMLPLPFRDLNSNITYLPYLTFDFAEAVRKKPSSRAKKKKKRGIESRQQRQQKKLKKKIYRMKETTVSSHTI